MSIAYRCKMCGTEGRAELGCDPQDLATLGFNLSAWVNTLTCNRCYDFRDAYKGLAARIFRVCRVLELSSPSRRQSAEEAIRAQLTEQTKRLVTLVAHRFDQQNVWDEQIVDALIAKPDQVGPQVSHIYHSIRKGLWANAAQQELETNIARFGH